MVINILIWCFSMCLISFFLSYKNFLYNKKIYKKLSKMVFVNEDKCIKGYLSDKESACFYYWKDSNDFTLDTSLDVFIHKSLLWTNLYNIYWYFKFKKFVLKQKTYTYLDFYKEKEKIFLYLKRDEILNEILNN